MNPFSIRKLLTASLALSAISTVLADVRLPAIFSDHMVLQRKEPVPIWGWATDGEEVTVKFRDQTHTVKATGGRWQARLNALEAGGPDTLTISGKNTLQLTNVLVGEVWICSGQSNMEWPLRLSFEPAEEIAKSANPQLRLFTVPKAKANEPLPDVVETEWVEARPETTAGFSAVAYFFGRDLQKALNVPVGLIHTSWGGSPAEVWVKESDLRASDEFNTEIIERYADSYKRQQASIRKWEQEAEAARTSGKRPPGGRPGGIWKPSELYNGMIAPLLPYAVQGAIWYQGESNAGRADQYQRLFADMIKTWRRDFRQDDFPFLMVQLAPWDKNRKRSMDEISAVVGDSDWAELREAQLQTTRNLPKVGMAVITDAGDKDDIHPNKKEPAGARLALLAREIAYGEDLVSSGPVFKDSKIKGNEVTLSFDEVGGGLKSEGEKLTGFSIAGEDRKFVAANARVEGKNTVVVSSSSVEKPVAVRFGWSDFPVVNLFNAEGLPASPFRTDDFPLTTVKK